MGLNAIVWLDKFDRVAAGPDWVVDQVLELFGRGGANDKQFGFPFISASGLNGYGGNSADILEGDMPPLFETIVDKVPVPDVHPEEPFQMQVTSLAYSSYVGVIGTGRIKRGRIKPNTPVAVVNRDGTEIGRAHV